MKKALVLETLGRGSPLATQVRVVLEPVGTRRLEAVDSVIWRPVLRVRRRRRPRIGQRLAGSSGKVVIV